MNFVRPAARDAEATLETWQGVAVFMLQIAAPLFAISQISDLLLFWAGVQGSSALSLFGDVSTLVLLLWYGFSVGKYGRAGLFCGVASFLAVYLTVTSMRGLVTRLGTFEAYSTSVGIWLTPSAAAVGTGFVLGALMGHLGWNRSYFPGLLPSAVALFTASGLALLLSVFSPYVGTTPFVSSQPVFLVFLALICFLTGTIFKEYHVHA